MSEEYRFVVCVDVEAEDLEAAYSKLLDRMSGNDWESSDEAYNPDGIEIPLSSLNEARLNVLSKLGSEESIGNSEICRELREIIE